MPCLLCFVWITKSWSESWVSTRRNFMSLDTQKCVQSVRMRRHIYDYGISWVSTLIFFISPIVGVFNHLLESYGRIDTLILTVGDNFSRRPSELFSFLTWKSLTFHANCIPKIVSLRNNLHEMSYPISGENKKENNNTITLSSVEFVHGVVNIVSI